MDTDVARWQRVDGADSDAQYGEFGYGIDRLGGHCAQLAWVFAREGEYDCFVRRASEQDLARDVALRDICVCLSWRGARGIGLRGRACKSVAVRLLIIANGRIEQIDFGSRRRVRILTDFNQLLQVGFDRSNSLRELAELTALYDLVVGLDLRE
jgi:hypothetical protein